MSLSYYGKIVFLSLSPRSGGVLKGFSMSDGVALSRYILVDIFDGLWIEYFNQRMRIILKSDCHFQALGFGDDVASLAQGRIAGAG